MPNPNVKSGFSPVKTQSGSPYTGAVRIYSIPASDGTAVYIGDPVKLAGTGSIVNGVVYQDVIQAATGDVITGAVVSVLPDTRDSLTYRAASTLRLVAVCDDPNMLFEIQEDGGATAFTANDIGLNANFSVGTGSAITGLSSVQLDTTTEATTNTLDLKLVEFVNRPDNAIGSNARWLVRFNKHRFVNQVAGV